MIYKYNEKVDVKEICDLRQSVGWNRMEKEMAEPPRRLDKANCTPQEACMIGNRLDNDILFELLGIF